MKHKNKKISSSGCKITAKLRWTVISVVVLMISTFAFFSLRYYKDNKAPGFDSDYVLYLYPDTPVDAVLDSLVSGAHAHSERSLRRMFAKVGLNDENMPKPGKYVIQPQHSPVYVARMLLFGWQTPQNLTLSGTLRKKDRLAQVISRQMMVDSADVADALTSDEFLSQYGFNSSNVFAMILPDTYQLYWTATVEEIFARFKKEYSSFWTDERRSKAEKIGLDTMQVSVMASIVNGETLKKEEYPVIAGVYLNRYNRGMKLQADPTVCYCFDYTLDRVLKVHLKVDSPYNTYKYAGLPPAPINVPPKACIDAVLDPDKHGYIYFCASPAFDGSHNFAVTYSEHLANARAFHRALTQRRKASQKP